jgi:hypothetical protein
MIIICHTLTCSGSFLIGPELLDADAAINAVPIFVGREEARDLRLIVYQVNSGICTRTSFPSHGLTRLVQQRYLLRGG